MALNVYSSDGSTVRATLCKYQYEGEFMGERKVTANLDSPIKIDWEIGDYVEVRGMVFTMRSLPKAKKQSKRNEYGAGIVYEDITFQSVIWELEQILFKDYVTGDNNLHYSGLSGFSFYVDSLDDIASRILANIRRAYPGLIGSINNPGNWSNIVDGSYWKIVIAIDTFDGDFLDEDGNVIVKAVKEADLDWDTQSVTIEEGTSLHDALNLYNSLFDLNYIITRKAGGNVIVIGGDSSIYEYNLKYGKDNGLLSLERTNDSSEKIITRLHVYGSTRNLPYRYYNTFYKDKKKYPKFFTDKIDADGNTEVKANYLLESMYVSKLMLPYEQWVVQGRIYDTYIDSDNIDKYGIREHVVTFDGTDEDWDEIYPTIHEMKITDFTAGMIGYESGYEGKTYTYLRALGNLLANYYNKSDKDETSTADMRSAGYIYAVNFIADRTGTTPYTSKPVMNKPTTTNILMESWEIAARAWALGYPCESYNDNNELVVSTNVAFGNVNNTEANSIISDIKVLLASMKYDKNEKTYWRSWNNYVEDETLPTYTYEITQEQIDAVAKEIADKVSDNDLKERLDVLIGVTESTDCGVSSDGEYSEDSLDIDGALMTTTFEITIPQLFFDIADFISEDETPTLCMKTGTCAGREFEILDCTRASSKYYERGWKLKCKRDDSDLSALNMIFPNSSYELSVGDEFVLIGIYMPSVYVQAAEQRLLKQGKEYLEEYNHELYQYNVTLNNQYLAMHQDLALRIQEGMSIIFNDRDESDDDEAIGDLGCGTTSRYIKQLTIKYNEDYLPQYEVQLEDDVDAVNISELINTEVKKHTISTGKTTGITETTTVPTTITTGSFTPTLRMLKWSDCEVGYVFEYRNYHEDNDIYITDVVIDDDGNYYMCKMSHAKFEGEELTDTVYWSSFQYYKNISTDLLLAEESIIGNLLLNNLYACQKNDDGTWDTQHPTIYVDGDTGVFHSRVYEDLSDDGSSYYLADLQYGIINGTPLLAFEWSKVVDGEQDLNAYRSSTFGASGLTIDDQDYDYRTVVRSKYTTLTDYLTRDSDVDDTSPELGQLDNGICLKGAEYNSLHYDSIYKKYKDSAQPRITVRGCPQGSSSNYEPKVNTVIRPDYIYCEGVIEGRSGFVTSTSLLFEGNTQWTGKTGYVEVSNGYLLFANGILVGYTLEKPDDCRKLKYFEGD